MLLCVHGGVAFVGNGGVKDHSNFISTGGGGTTGWATEKLPDSVKDVDEPGVEIVLNEMKLASINALALSMQDRKSVGFCSA